MNAEQAESGAVQAYQRAKPAFKAFEQAHPFIERESIDNAISERRDDWRRLNTRLLVIQTAYSEIVKELLIGYNLANEAWFEDHAEGYVYVRFPQDLMSLSLWFWLHAAQTCGLIERWIQ